MKIKAELLPLEDKYYGTYIKLSEETGEEVGEFKVWLPYQEFGIEALSPREVENIDKEDDINEILSDWDYAHSENKITYRVAKAIVEALNNKEI